VRAKGVGAWYLAIETTCNTTRSFLEYILYTHIEQRKWARQIWPSRPHEILHILTQNTFYTHTESKGSGFVRFGNKDPLNTTRVHSEYILYTHTHSKGSGFVRFGHEDHMKYYTFLLRIHSILTHREQRKWVREIRPQRSRLECNPERQRTWGLFLFFYENSLCKRWSS